MDIGYRERRIALALARVLSVAQRPTRAIRVCLPAASAGVLLALPYMLDHRPTIDMATAGPQIVGRMIELLVARPHAVGHRRAVELLLSVGPRVAVDLVAQAGAARIG